MRWVHIAVLAVLAIATLVFALQNLQGASVHFLNFTISLPIAILVVVIYVIGMFTGGSLWSFIRWGIQGVKGA